jgi:type I restriction enzyme, S subunit
VSDSGTDWPYRKFGEVCQEKAQGPGIAGAHYNEKGNVAILRTTDISADGRINLEGMTRASVDLERLGSHILKVGDLVITRSGRFGTAALFTGYDLPVIPAGYSTRFRLGGSADPRFYLYFFNSEAGQSALRSRAVGSVQQNLAGTAILDLEVPCPPLDEQRAISSVLGSLDDKIDLNRRMNQTLEQIAQVLFKSWFVDFDPVRAKAEGRWKKGESLPGMPADMWGLWAGVFEESEIGEIPNGWKLSTVGTETKTVLGGTPSRAEESYWTAGTVGWINSSEVNRFRIVEPTERITEAAVSNSAAELLPHHTTVLAITGATIGQVSISEISTTTNQSVVAVLSTDKLPTEFLYLWVRNRIGDLIAGQTGGAQQHINKNDVNDLLLLVCPDSIMGRFLALSGPLFSRICANEFESLSLRDLRDALLPKLLSGEIRVPSHGGQ